jgi:hypothetical protein
VAVRRKAEVPEEVVHGNIPLRVLTEVYIGI